MTQIDEKHNAETTLLTRRTFLRSAAAGAASLALLHPSFAFAGQTTVPGKPFPFKLGLQSYSLREMSLADALAKTKALGLHWWEGFPGHVPITSDAAKIASYQQTFKDNNVRMISYGVLDFSADEADARSKFQFAKAMGIQTITASPQPESLPLLDKLTQEFQINIGIHNHGPGDARYGDWQQVLAAMEGHNARIGACDDTGHYLMADKNPITAAVKFGKRLYSIHMKSVGVGPGQKKDFTPIGTTGGLLDVVQLLRFLKEGQYKGILAIEEEDPSGDPVANVTTSVEAMRRYINTVNTVMLKPGA